MALSLFVSVLFIWFRRFFIFIFSEFPDEISSGWAEWEEIGFLYRMIKKKESVSEIGRFILSSVYICRASH